MAQKRKRDVANGSESRPLESLLSSLEGDLVSIQGSIPQLQQYVTACRKLPDSGAAQKLEKHLAPRKSFNELCTAFDTALASNNKSVLASLCTLTRSILALRIIDLASFQQSLSLQVLDRSAPAIKKALGPGHNEATAAALNLLCVIVRDVTEERWSSRARQTWDILSADAQNLVRMLGVRHRNQARASKKSDIRTLVLGIFVPLLSPTSPAALREDLLSVKGLLPGVFKGIVDDEAPVIYGVLHAFFIGGIYDKRLSVEQRCQLADVCWQPLLSLTSDLPKTHQKSEYAQRFLLASISFLANDASSQSPSALRACHKSLSSLLSNLRPGDSEVHADITLALLGHCPDLSGFFWQRTFPSLDPRLTSRWIASITLATRLICAETSASPQHSSNFQNLMDTCFPACFSHAWASKGLAHDNPLIAYLVALFLMSCLQKTAATVQSLSSQNTARSSALAKRIRSDVSERLPDPKNVINLLQKGASEAPANSDEHGIALLTYLRLIKLYYQFAPSTTTAMRYDFTKLVDPLLSDPSATEPNALLAASQIAFFELTTLPGVDINWLKGTSDNAPIYKLCSVILASTVPAVRDSGTKALIHCLSRSNLFEQEQSLEMAVWICALRGSTTGHRKAVTFLFGSSLQKASSSTFKCIEEVERLLPKHGSSSVSPLLAGWKQQCGYLSEHRPEDLRAAQSASTRVAQGYLGSHDHRTCQNVQHALKVDSVQEIVGEESTDHHDAMESALYDTNTPFNDLTLSAINSAPVSTGSQLCIKLKTQILLHEQSEQLSLRLHKLSKALESPAAVFVATELCEQNSLLQLARSISDKEELQKASALIRNVIALDVANDVEMKLVAQLSRLFEDASEDPSKNASLLSALSPILNVEQRARLLNSLAKTCTEPTEHPQKSLWRQLLSTVALKQSFERLTPQLCQSLIQLGTGCLAEEANACLAAIIESTLPLGLRKDGGQASASFHPALSLADARRISSKWTTAFFERKHTSSASAPTLQAAILLSQNGRAQFASWFARLHPNSGCCEEAWALLADISGWLRLAPRLPDGLAEEMVRTLPACLDSRFDLACRAITLATKMDDGHQMRVAASLAEALGDLPPASMTSDILNLAVEAAGCFEEDRRRPIVGAAVDKCLLWLVRRFAEDPEDTPATLDLASCLTLKAPLLKEQDVKEHLLAPVVTAIVQNRLLCKEAMELAASLLPFSKGTSSTRWTQQILSHGQLRRAMTPDCTSRECLIAVLIQLNKRLGKFDAPSELFITLLSAYRGTLASCDMWIKDALKTAELQGIWSLTQHITQTEAVLSLHGVSEPATGPRVLAVLDPDAVYASCIACTSAELGSEHKHVYDPEFILGLLAAFIGGAIDVQDFMLLVRANVLGVPITGLSSSNPSIRQASDRILARLRVRLQSAEFTEKEELMLVLQHAQQMVASGAASNISSMFLAQCCRSLATPEDAHYPLLSRHLLQRSTIDFTDIPLLYQMLYPTEQDKAASNRHWMIKLLRDGMQAPRDWLALRRRQTWDLLAGLFTSGSLSHVDKVYVVEFLLRATRQDVAVSDLVRRSGILSFLQQNAMAFCSFDSETVFGIILNILQRLSPHQSAANNNVLWMDVSDTVWAMASAQGHPAAVNALKCLRQLVLGVSKCQVDSKVHDHVYAIVSASITTIWRTHNETLDALMTAQLHDIALRTSFLASQQHKEATVTDLERVLRDLASKASGRSDTIRALLLTRIHDNAENN